MKPTPKSEEFKAFTETLRRIVQVPKSAVYTPKKPRTKGEASGRVSDKSV